MHGAKDAGPRVALMSARRRYIVGLGHGGPPRLTTPSPSTVSAATNLPAPALIPRFHRFRPRLLDALRGYNRQQFSADLGAGLTMA